MGGGWGGRRACACGQCSRGCSSTLLTCKPYPLPVCTALRCCSSSCSRPPTAPPRCRCCAVWRRWWRARWPAPRRSSSRWVGGWVGTPPPVWMPPDGDLIFRGSACPADSPECSSPRPIVVLTAGPPAAGAVPLHGAAVPPAGPGACGGGGGAGGGVVRAARSGAVSGVGAGDRVTGAGVPRAAGTLRGDGARFAAAPAAPARPSASSCPWRSCGRSAPCRGRSPATAEEPPTQQEQGDGSCCWVGGSCGSCVSWVQLRGRQCLSQCRSALLPSTTGCGWCHATPNSTTVSRRRGVGPTSDALTGWRRRRPALSALLAALFKCVRMAVGSD